MGQLNLLRMMNDVEPLAAMNTSFVLVQSLLLGGSSGRPSEPGLSERYLQHFRSPLANATPPLAAPDARHPDDEAPDWASVGVAPADEHLLMPEWAYQVAAAYLVVVCVLGVVMNAMVVVVILNDPQKTPLNWMILNLALSDGAIAGFGAPVSTAAALQTGWHFGDEFCVAYAMIMSTAGIGSITTLSALALWRCTLVVTCPARRPAGFGAGSGPGSGGALPGARAALLLVVIWLYTLAVTAPPLVGWGRYDREAAHISCSVNWETRADNNAMYVLYMFAMGLVVPLLVIVGSYASILRVVKKTGEMKRKTLVSMTSQPQQEAGGQQQPATQHHDNNNTKQASGALQPHYQSDAAERRVTIMVACMIGAFLVAWTPYSVLALVETFADAAPAALAAGDALPLSRPVHRSSVSPGAATVPSLFAKTSAIFNPLIYGLLNTQFRSAWARFTARVLGRGRQQRHHPRHQRPDEHRAHRAHRETAHTPTVIAMNEFHERGASSVVMFVTQHAGTELMALSPTQMASSNPPGADGSSGPPDGRDLSPRSISCTSPFTITTATHLVGGSHYAELFVEPPADFESCHAALAGERDDGRSLVAVRHLSDTVVRCNGADREPPVTELAEPSVVALHPVE